MKYKPDWQTAKTNLIRWWGREGLALSLTAPRSEPLEPLGEPDRPDDMLTRWTDPTYRLDVAESRMVRTKYYAEAFPYFDAYLGPGSLATMLGSTPVFTDASAWYTPCIDDPDLAGPIRFDPTDNRWLDAHQALIDETLRRCPGRYLPGVPDLVEGLDTLAAMRGNEGMLMDLVDRPGWVHEKLAEINEAYYAVFDRLVEKVRDADGGNAFSAFGIWGPGRTAKVQCDICCMISPPMFDEFVVPQLTTQCEWLDYSMYHLDGEDALPHLDSLLGIAPLDAIEWTPVGASGKVAGRPNGGSPVFYDLYRRIKDAGKSVQAIRVTVDEVVPLLDAVGPEAMFLTVVAPDEAAAEKLVEAVEPYRR